MLEQEREQSLFFACLELKPPERASYLAQACGDDVRLRERIERLVDAHARAENEPLAPLHSATAEAMPDEIGPYRLIALLGEGGMGAVYEAEQTEPVQRRVALKVIKAGMDSRQVVARFLAERQALAALDHPFVAKVFDGGQTVTGRPFFAMELVHGVPVRDFCDANRLTVRERVELFILICQAVQHAHQKGVIHRDLKPSNILVGETDGKPLPKIIDFGIAKAVGFDFMDEPVELTRAGQTLGTPAYMSPEQAALGGIDIDTRTDIYSLGVMLYELLTGTLPSDPSTTGHVEFLSLLARAELQPPRPSARARQSSLRKEIEGDLDWIVMKALEAARSRRYETAAALAEDLARYLKEEPVSARPPTLGYRLGKFTRRHRLQVGAAAIVAVAIAGGAIAAGIGLVRATRAEAQARQEAATAREVSDFLVRLFGLPDPNATPGSPVTVRELLDRGARRIETELKGQPRVQSNLLGTLSHVYESLGQYKEAKKLAEQGLAVEKTAKLTEDLKTAETLVALGRVQHRLGELEPARQTFQRALEIRTRFLGENHLDVSVVLNSLGGVYGQMEKFEEAIGAHQRALAIQRRVGGPEHITIYNSLRGIGIVHDRKGEWEAALESFRGGYAIVRKKYAGDHPLVASSLGNMARMLTELKRLDEARTLSEQALEMQKKLLGPNHPSVAFACHDLGRVLEEQGKLEEALAMYQEGLRIREAALGKENLRTADLLLSVGRLRVKQGKLDEGRETLARTFEIYRRAYGPDHSETLESERELALVLVKSKQYAEAMPYLREVALRELPPALRVDLKNSDFDGMRSLPSFRALAEEVQSKGR